MELRNATTLTPYLLLKGLAMPATPALKSFKKGFKYPIYPTPEQLELLARTAGSCRYVWNRALAEAKAEFEQYTTLTALGTLNVPKPNTTGYGFTAKLPRYKADEVSLWLGEVSAVALQQTLLHLGSAYSRFFKERKGFPRFKSKHDRQSFSLVSTAFSVRDGVFRIAKSADPLAIHWIRPLPSEPSSCTLSRSATGQWYASFICEHTPKPTTGTKITGIDLGLKSFAVLSSGEAVANPKHFTRTQRLLKRRQQALSRKQKGSANRAKARLAVAKTHERIAHQRNDHLHKLSRRLVDENQVIGMESLNVKGMVKNRRLAKSISDAAWSTFRQYVVYKASESQHCSVVLMHAFYPSSHICSDCGVRLGRKLDLSERSWVCPHCGATHDRDINAALNIRDEAERAYRGAGCPQGVVLLANMTHSVPESALVSNATH